MGYKNGRCIQTLKHFGSVYSVAFNQLGDRLATGCDDGNALIWDVKNGRCIQTLKHPGPVRSVAFNLSGDQLATACDDKKARIWNLAACKKACDMLEKPTPQLAYLLRACQEARAQSKPGHTYYVHLEDDAITKTYENLPERLRNALRQFIVTKGQYDRIKKNSGADMSD